MNAAWGSPHPVPMVMPTQCNQTVSAALGKVLDIAKTKAPPTNHAHTNTPWTTDVPRKVRVTMAKAKVQVKVKVKLKVHIKVKVHVKVKVKVNVKVQ